MMEEIDKCNNKITFKGKRNAIQHAAWTQGQENI